MTHLRLIGSSLARRSIARISLALGTFLCCFPKLTYTLNGSRCYASWAEHPSSQFIIQIAKCLQCAQKPYYHLRESGVSEGGQRGGMGVLSWPLRANCTPFFQTPCSVVAHDETDQARSIYKMWKSVDATNEGFLISEWVDNISLHALGWKAERTLSFYP